MEDNNQIKFALFLEDWKFETGDKKSLRRLATQITTTEYTRDMKGHIFCPECCVGLFRSPEEKDYDTAGRKAFFAHSSKHKLNCSLRVKKAPGKRYDSEELAKKAIESEELVVIKGFMKERPRAPKTEQPQQYKGEPVEDIDGQLSEVSIGRHNGETFSLPSRITTVRGICRNFNKNLYKYFHLPGKKHAIQLKDVLVDIRNVKETDEDPKFYFGIVSHSWNCGTTPQNIRQTMFKYSSEEFKDFCLKATDEVSREHGIDDEAKGKIVIMFGSVVESGIGLAIERVGWGEFAILPDKYSCFLL